MSVQDELNEALALMTPCDVMDIEYSGKHFVLRLLYFTGKPTRESIDKNGLSAQFGILYEDKGMRCEFETDCQISSIRDLTVDLENIYDGGTNRREAVLVNYGTEEHSFLSFAAVQGGGWTVTGRFANKENGYSSGISFEWNVDRAYGSMGLDVICSTGKFIHRLYEIQGHNRYN